MTDERDVKKTYARPDFVAELRRLADALEAGEAFTVEIDGEQVSVPADAVVSVEHEREDGREEIAFELNWDLTDEDEDGEDNAADAEEAVEDAAEPHEA